MSRYHTLGSRTRFQPEPVKGSRFVATVAPVTTEEEALAFVHDIEREWPNASHHCWAYRLKDGRSRSSDAGEPGGSAGRPILAQIEGHDLRDVAVVVSRWFGGTKLGVGGLVRAYGGAAGMALDRADVRQVHETLALRVVHGYSDTGAIDAVLAAEGLERRDLIYEAEVSFLVDVPLDDEARVRDALLERTGGRVRLSAAGPPSG